MDQVDAPKSSRHDESSRHHASDLDWAGTLRSRPRLQKSARPSKKLLNEERRCGVKTNVQLHRTLAQHSELIWENAKLQSYETMKMQGCSERFSSPRPRNDKASQEMIRASWLVWTFPLPIWRAWSVAPVIARDLFTLWSRSSQDLIFGITCEFESSGPPAHRGRQHEKYDSMATQSKLRAHIKLSGWRDVVVVMQECRNVEGRV